MFIQVVNLVYININHIVKKIKPLKSIAAEVFYGIFL
jgi:hypothetical protein